MKTLGDSQFLDGCMDAVLQHEWAFIESPGGS